MKYLKTFESLYNIENEIRDILLDITDDGLLTLDIKEHNLFGHDRLDIMIRGDKSFNWNNVSESVLDLKSHLSDRYYLNRIWGDLSPGYSIGGISTADRPEIYPKNELSTSQYKNILRKIVLNFEKI